MTSGHGNGDFTNGNTSTASTPNFDTRMEAVATSQFSGKESLDMLTTWLRLNKWRGELRITFPGNGGVSSVCFTEKVSMTEAQYHHGFNRNGNEQS